MKEVKLDTPAEIEEAIHTISTLGAFLVNAAHGNTQWVEVGVWPAGKNSWQVAVRYEGFTISESGKTLADALRAMLSTLTTRVAMRLEQGRELLKG